MGYDTRHILWVKFVGGRKDGEVVGIGTKGRFHDEIHLITMPIETHVYEQHYRGERPWWFPWTFDFPGLRLKVRMVGSEVVPRARHEGRAAFDNGRKLAENPYDKAKDVLLYNEWQLGYRGEAFRQAEDHRRNDPHTYAEWLTYVQKGEPCLFALGDWKEPGVWNLLPDPGVVARTRRYRPVGFLDRYDIPAVAKSPLPPAPLPTPSPADAPLSSGACESAHATPMDLLAEPAI